VERNLYWVTDGICQSAFLTTDDGVVLLDAPPTIGGNLRRAVDEIAAANGVTKRMTHLVHSHHHAAHGGTASLFDGDVVRIGHEETRRLLLRDNDPARPLPEVTFADRYTLEVEGDRVEHLRSGEQFARLARGEPQIAGAKLGHLVGEPELMQSDRRIAARRQHHTRGFRKHAEQVLKLTAPPEPDRIAMPLSGASQIMRSLRPDRSRRAVSPATVPSSRLRRR
jgi:hypothetical protein